MENKKAFEEMMDKRWPAWNCGGKYWTPTKVVMLERAFLDGIELERDRHLTNAMRSDCEDQDGFRLQITSMGNNTIVSGDLSPNKHDGFVVKLHNNGKEFVNKDSDRAVLIALVDWLLEGGQL